MKLRTFGLILILVTFVILALSGCSSEPLRPRDQALEISFQVLNSMDAITTARIEDHPNLNEGSTLTKEIIGEHPTSAQAFQYFIAYGIAHYFVVRALPPKWRPWVQGASIADTTHSLIKNCNNGLCDSESSVPSFSH